MDPPQLLTHLEPELLRGVPLHDCLSGWGKHWRPPDPGMFKVQADNWALSRPAESIDDFLSHDWGSSRWMKFLAMLIIYNSRAALIATLLSSLALGVARASGALPDLRLTIVGIGYGVHLFFLCFWQRFRQMLCTCRLVFLDKLCIAQSPELADLKAKGILGLAAFLNHSKRLVVLWSPAYFSRLWCSYEIATWLTGGNEEKPVVVMPVHGAPVLLVEYAAWAAVASSFWYVVYNMLVGNASGVLFLIPGAVGKVLIGTLLVAVPAMLWGVPLFAMEISLARHLLDVRGQLRTYRMQETRCFCCSNNHRHPDTGETIPCDRKLVYIKLKEWYSHPGDVGEEYLDHFNNLVQTRLASAILGKMSNFIPHIYTFYMLAAANVPWLSDALPRALSQIEPAENYLLEFAYILLEWIMMSLVVFLGSRCSSSLAFVGVRLARSMPLLLVAFLLFQVAALPVVISLGSFWFLRMGPGNASGILLAIPPGLVLLVLIGLNVRKCPGRRPRELELTAVTKSTDTSKDIAMSSDPDASCEQVAVIDCGSPTSSRLVVGSTDTSKLVARSGEVIDCTSPTSSRFTL